MEHIVFRETSWYISKRRVPIVDSLNGFSYLCLLAVATVRKWEGRFVFSAIDIMPLFVQKGEYA